MKRYQLRPFMLGVTMIMMGATAHAGSTDLTGLKLPCATFKAGKLIQKTTCTVTDGMMSGNVWGSGISLTLSFVGINGQKYTFEITDRYITALDSNYNPLYDDSDRLVIADHITMLNNKLTYMQYRMPKNFEILNESQEILYKNLDLESGWDKNIIPYHCHTLQGDDNEFCYQMP